MILGSGESSWIQIYDRKELSLLHQIDGEDDSMEFIGASMTLVENEEGQAHLWYTSSNIGSDTLEVHSAIL